MECNYCGRPTGEALAGVPICETCYEQAGGCCLEFGGDDLWHEPAAGAITRGVVTPQSDEAAADRHRG
jgi:hypothetical protein